MPAVLPSIFIAAAFFFATPICAGEKAVKEEPSKTALDPALAGRIDCVLLLNGDTASAKPIPGLKSALNDLRSGSGAPKPMTEERFAFSIRNLALYLMGQKTAEDLEGNRFFKASTGKIQLEEPLKGLFEGDSALIHRAVYEGIQAEFVKVRYDGRSTADVKKEIAKEETVLIFTHQLLSLQAVTAERLNGYADLKGIRPITLVGTDSSERLDKTSTANARLVMHSVGGDFELKLTKLKKAVIAGGALDQCLLQTIHSIIKNTKGDIVIEVLQPLSYIDLIDSPHVTITDFIKDYKDELADYQRRLRHEVEQLLGDDNYDVAKVTRPSPKVLPSMSITHPRGRKIEIVFRQ